MLKILISILLFILPVAAIGQYAPLTDHYLLNPMIINPSYAGSIGVLAGSVFFRTQWIGLEGAPCNMALILDAPLPNDKTGFGINLLSDKIGINSATRFIGAYSFKLKMKDGNLTFGLGGGFTAGSAARSKLIVVDPGDEKYLVDKKLFFLPEICFGLNYKTRRFFAGFSIPQMITYSYNKEKNKFTLNNSPSRYNYLAYTGYYFKFTNTVQILPSALIRYLPGSAPCIDLNLHFIYADFLRSGLSYRTRETLSALLQININRQLSIAYAYDFDLGRLSHLSKNSHEIMLCYVFRYTGNAIGPRNF